MSRFSLRSLPAIIAVLALFGGAWLVRPQATVAAQQDATVTVTGVVSGTPAAGETAQPSESATAVVSETPVAGTPVVTATTTQVARGTQKQMLDYIASFSLDATTVTSANVSAADRSFLDAALAMNTMEIQTMQTAIKRAHNKEVRSLAQMMLAMHQKDQTLLTQLQTNVGGNTRPALDRVAFLPGSPEQTLGFNWINLNVVFANKLKHVSNGNPFDLAFLDVAAGSHAFAVETAQTAFCNSQNTSIQALARHVAQEASLHEMLIIALRDRLFYKSSTPIIFPQVPVVPTQPGMTETPGAPGATETAVPGMTETTVPGMTETAVPGMTETVVPGMTETPVAGGTQQPTTVPSSPAEIGINP